jgi:4-amino-4-deoxy-L-arabinose transferase-like glycosyltransferase
VTTPSVQALWREAALFALGAAAYRCAFWLAMPRVIDTADAIHYLQYAEQLAAQGAGDLDPRITPLFPALTALVAAAGIELEFAARLVSFVAGTLTAPAVYWLAITLFDRPAARVAALAVAIWPWLADYSCRVAPEALAVLFWVLGAAFVVRAVASRYPLPAAAFGCWFVVHLTRPEGTVLLLAVPVLAAVLYPGLDIATRLRNVAPYLAAAVMALVAYTFAMGAATGQASISGRVPDVTESLRHVFVERGSEMASAFLTLFTELLPVMLGPILLLFAGAGLFMRGVMPRSVRGELMVIAVCAVQFGCAVLSTYAEPRYLMAVVIVGAIYAARGIVLVGRQAAGTRPSLKHAPIAVLIATMLFGTTVTLVSEYTGRVPREPREYKIAGQWMRDNLDPGLIFTRKPQIGFYADMPTTGPEPSESLNQAIARARDSGAEYVVIDERYTAQMAPALQPLLDPANAPAALELIRADLSPYDKARIVIYRLRGTP